MSNQYISVDPIIRFHEKILGEPNSGCLLWTADCFGNGYGKFWFEGKSRKAHRVAWEWAHGKIETGKIICHKCDTPSCVRVDHLFIGTHKDNAEDRDKKGRKRSVGRKGELQNKARLKEWQIPLIRADKRASHIAAKDYGISPRQFCAIRQGIYWRHV